MSEEIFSKKTIPKKEYELAVFDSVKEIRKQAQKDLREEIDRIIQDRIKEITGKDRDHPKIKHRLSSYFNAVKGFVVYELDEQPILKIYPPMEVKSGVDELMYFQTWSQCYQKIEHPQEQP